MCDCGDGANGFAVFEEAGCEDFKGIEADLGGDFGVSIAQFGCKRERWC